MSVLTSEAVVLRTWPLREADLIVQLPLPAIRANEGRGQVGAEEPQTVWRGAGADDGGAGVVCREAGAGAGAAGSTGDSTVAPGRAGGSRTDGGVELFTPNCWTEAALANTIRRKTVFRCW